MRFVDEAADHGDWIGHQFARGDGFVGDAVDEAGIGAVLEQPADQVRQQILVAADRGVHPARHVELVLADHFRVQIVAHAVQFLVLVATALRHAMDRHDRVRVMGGEHRIQRIAGTQHFFRAGEVTQVGIGLAREHRIAGQAIDLCALDLGIPVRALDQPHRHLAFGPARGVDHHIEHERRAFLIRLHRQAIAVPALQRRVDERAQDHVQRQFQPIGFLGIDGETDRLRLGEPGQFQHARRQLGKHPRALAQFVAWMQCRELDRDRGRVDPFGRSGRCFAHATGNARADRQDRLAVGLEIARGIGRREGCFAEHVERIAIGRIVALVRACKCVLDAATQHELVAHDPHRLAHGHADHRLAGAPDQALERAADTAPGGGAQTDQLAGQQQAPTGGVDQHRIALAQMRFPVGLAKLVANELVGGGLIGDPQQRLGHAHQQHAFLTGQVVLAHEGIDHALVGDAGSHALH